MKKMEVVSAIVAAVIISLTAETHAAGAGVWSKPAIVKLIYPRIFMMGGGGFPGFEFKTLGNPLNDDGTVQSGGTLCGESTRVGLRSLDGTGYDQQVKSLQSMQSGLFAAFAAGKKIRIKWDGSVCFANEIVLCSDDACSNF